MLMSVRQHTLGLTGSDCLLLFCYFGTSKLINALVETSLNTFTSFKDGAVLFNLLFTQDGKATLAGAYFGLWEV
jgi:hypothetical protein